jgi:acyl carrier protein
MALEPEHLHRPQNQHRSRGELGMTDQEILDLLTRVLRDLLENDSIVLTTATRRQEVPNWDSLMYINFIVAVEIELGIKFKVADVESFANVGEIVATIRTMLK